MRKRPPGGTRESSSALITRWAIPIDVAFTNVVYVCVCVFTIGTYFWLFLTTVLLLSWRSLPIGSSIAQDSFYVILRPTLMQPVPIRVRPFLPHGLPISTRTVSPSCWFSALFQHSSLCCSTQLAVFSVLCSVLVKSCRCKTDDICFNTLIAYNRYVCWQVFTSRSSSMCDSTLYYSSLPEKKSFRLQHCFVHIVIANAFISLLARLLWLKGLLHRRKAFSFFLFLSFFLVFMFIAACSHRARAVC